MIETTCPFCWEAVVLAVDTSAGDQEYIEDCAVCCRPMNIRVEVGPNGEVGVQVDA